MENELVRVFAMLWEQEMGRRQNEDYEVNPIQMDRFLDILSFFKQKVDPEFDDGIEPFLLEAKEECGGFSVRFCVFDLHGDEVPTFAKLISGCSAITVDAASDSQICISLTVPNLFVRRKK